MKVIYSCIGALGVVLLSELEFFYHYYVDYQHKTSNLIGGKNQTHPRNCI